MTIDRPKFFDHVRSSLFGGRLTEQQVQGMEAILAEGERHGLAKAPLAYVLATAYHETGRAMWPVREVGRGKGRAYGKRDPMTGQTYYGRGFVQLTWRKNYRKMSAYVDRDLVKNPDLALDLQISATILVTGMVKGLFTGKMLFDYFRPGAPTDFIGARRIVNGMDRAESIAYYAQAFVLALNLAYAASPPVASAAMAAAPEPVPAPLPPPPPPDMGAMEPDPVSPATKERPMLSGYKTYIVVAIVAAGILAENVLGLDVPGFTPDPQWLKDTLLTGLAATLRAALGNGALGRLGF